MEHGFALALVLSLAAAQGGRAQIMVAQLSARLGRRASLLLAALGTAALTAAAAAHAGAVLHGAVPIGAQTPIAAAALLAAAIALVMPPRPVSLREPTRSLGAIALALLLRQSIDAPRLGILAVAVLCGTPWPVAMGGALGSGAALTMAWVIGGRIRILSP